jgi:hypothetical protein
MIRYRGADKQIRQTIDHIVAADPAFKITLNPLLIP